MRGDPDQSEGDAVGELLVRGPGMFDAYYRPWRLRYFAGVFNVLDVRGAGSGYPVGVEIPTPTVPRYGLAARIGATWSF